MTSSNEKIHANVSYSFIASACRRTRWITHKLQYGHIRILKYDGKGGSNGEPNGWLQNVIKNVAIWFANIDDTLWQTDNPFQICLPTKEEHGKLLIREGVERKMNGTDKRNQSDSTSPPASCTKRSSQADKTLKGKIRWVEKAGRRKPRHTGI